MVADADGFGFVPLTFDLFQLLNPVVGEFINNAPSFAARCGNEVGCGAAVGLAVYVEGDAKIFDDLGAAEVFCATAKEVWAVQASCRAFANRYYAPHRFEGAAVGRISVGVPAVSWSDTAFPPTTSTATVPVIVFTPGVGSPSAVTFT